MNTTLDQMLTNVYELEGLLLVMQRHHDNIPQIVIDRFKEKANEIAAAAGVIDSLKKPDEATQSQPVAPPAHPEQPAVTPPAHPEKPAVTPPAHPEPPIFTPPTPPPPSPVHIAPPTPEPVIEPEPDTIIEPEPVEEPKFDTDQVCDTKLNVKTEEPFAPNTPSVPAITSAFSINDRFLFLRELFDGDKQKYDDAISVMQRLANIDKIKGFITDVLLLDPSNEVVKEFVRLIEQGLKG